MRASSSAARGPVVSQPERSVRVTASISSSPIAGGWNDRKVSLLAEISVIGGGEAYALGRRVRPRHRLLPRRAERQYRTGTIGTTPKLPEAVTRLPIDTDLLHPVELVG